MFNQQSQNPYPSEPPQLSAGDVEAPNYSDVLDWMRAINWRTVSLDMWARGNYVRRIIHQGQAGTPPLVVPFRTAEELRWAYRRLALLGLPVDFLYTQNVSRPKKVIHLYPTDLPISGGWGCIAALGSKYKYRGREFFPVFGNVRLMPDWIADWLVDEVAEAFTRGEVFIAPAELVGIHPSHSAPGVEALAETAQGTAVRHAKTAAALLQLELPSLEAMSSVAFEKFLREHQDDLTRFRAAFRRLVDGAEPSDLNDVVDDIRAEVAAMSQSKRYSAMRRNISILGGSLTTIAAGVAAAIAANPALALPIAGSAGAAAATACLVDMWKQRIDQEAGVKQNSFSLLWNLGVDRTERIQLSRQTVKVAPAQRMENAPPSVPAEFHWLCPPSVGMQLLAVKKDTKVGAGTPD
jgi:hypothetical protein